MLRRIFGRLGAATLVVVCLAGFPAMGEPAATPDQFVKTLADRAIEVVNSAELNYDEQVRRLRGLLIEGFDVPLMARFVLGVNWRRATPSQRDEYLKLFEEMIVQTYLRRFREYSGVEFVVDGIKQKVDGDYFVTSTVKRPGEPAFMVDWRVRDAAGGFKIIDVVAENLSMALSQRDDFSSVIQRYGGEVDGLLREMREKIEQAKGTARS
ncbi:MAG: ABC transporter substrate-binding protein [Proteobacteria bacterium]|nr:ABC transporter substrate-binding protein [Pseudomonadota bacterium]